MKFLLRSTMCRSMLVGICLWPAQAMAVAGFPLPCPTLPDTLGTAEVTAPRRPAALSSPTPVQRLDSADFRRQGITSVADALLRMAGVNLRDYGGAGGLKTVSVRGLGAAHTAVAYDGLCLSDHRRGEIDLQRYHPELLRSIELHPLGESSLLCPVRNLSAAAVVSLSAFHPDTLRRGLGGTATLKQSAFGSYHALGSLEGRTGQRSAASLCGDAFWSQNDYPFRVANGVASTRLRRTNSEMRGGSAEGRWWQRMDNGLWESTAGFYRNNRQLPGQVILYVNENHERLKETSAFAQTRRTFRPGGRTECFAALRYQWQHTAYSDIDAQYPGGALRQRYVQQEVYATGGLSRSLTPWLRLAYASDLSHAWLHSNLRQDNRALRMGWLQSLSAQVVAGRFKLLVREADLWYRDESRTAASAADAGRRTRHYHAFTPMASASYRLWHAPVSMYLRAGWQQSYRLPTFSEAYFDHLGQAALRPERTNQWNGGLTLSAQPAAWWPGLTLTVDGYTNRVSHRIVSVPYTLFVWRTLNMGRVDAHGLDATLSSHWQPAPQWALRLTANYSLQRVADRTSPGADTYGNQLAYTPRHSGAASVGCETPWLSLTAHCRYASERWSTNEHLPTTSLPAYCEWGFTMARSFALGRCRLDLRADLLNAFNCRYEVVRRYPMPGRAYALSATLRF